MIVVITFFATSPIKEKNNNGNKPIVAHFRFKQKREKKGDSNKLINVTLFVITREEKKM